MILQAIVRIDPQVGRNGGALKTANQLVREIGLAVQPPQGVAIVLTEHPRDEPNWVAAASAMEAALSERFFKKVAELRETDPLVDWDGVERGHPESHRVVKC
jgi:hypothetical protein